LADGTGVTWGDPQRGGDSSRVQFQLRKVEISATGGALAGILAKGVVVAWGMPGRGGDSSGVQDEFIEGSLEVKLPTIWTDEKQSRAEAERRERLEERRVEEKE